MQHNICFEHEVTTVSLNVNKSTVRNEKKMISADYTVSGVIQEPSSSMLHKLH